MVIATCRASSLGQLEQFSRQQAKLLALFERDFEIAAFFVGAQGIAFNLQGFEVALQRGERGAQIVRNIGDQFTPHRVVLLELLHLGHDPVCHLAERSREVVDVVWPPGAQRGLRKLPGVPALPDPVHYARKLRQATGDQPDDQRACEQREHEAAPHEPDAVPHEVVVLDLLCDAVAAQPAQDQVKVAVDSSIMRDRCDGEYALRVVFSRIVSEDGQLRIFCQKPAYGRETHAIALAHAGLARRCKYHSLFIEQVDVAPGIDEAQPVEDALNGIVIDMRVGGHHVLVDELRCERAIDHLVRFLPPHVVGVLKDQQEHH